jgi:hypothetical protein
VRGSEAEIIATAAVSTVESTTQSPACTSRGGGGWHAIARAVVARVSTVVALPPPPRARAHPRRTGTDRRGRGRGRGARVHLNRRRDGWYGGDGHHLALGFWRAPADASCGDGWCLRGRADVLLEHVREQPRGCMPALCLSVSLARCLSLPPSVSRRRAPWGRSVRRIDLCWFQSGMCAGR